VRMGHLLRYEFDHTSGMSTSSDLCTIAAPSSKSLTLYEEIAGRK
jgi:hypothetical protein